MLNNTAKNRAKFTSGSNLKRYPMSRKLTIEIIIALLINLFVYAGLSKLFGYRVFSSQLAQSPLLSPWAGTIAWVLPAGELLLAAMLVIPATRLAGLYASLGLLILFTAYIIYMLATYPHLPCSCGGVIAALSWKQHIAFNSVFILLAGVGIRLLKGSGWADPIEGSTKKTRPVRGV